MNSQYDIVIVDTRLMAFNQFHAKRHPILLLQSLSNTLSYLGVVPKTLVFVGDVGKSRFRKELYPEYKANREVIREAYSSAEKTRYQQFNKDYKNLLELFKYFGRVLAIPGVEADDAANIVVEKYKDSKKILLVSADVDWTQMLVNDNVDQVSPNNNTLFDRTNIKDGLTAEQIKASKIFVGDSGDNIKGLYRFGPVAFNKTVEACASYDEFMIADYLKNTGVKLPPCFNSIDELVEVNRKLVSLLTMENLNEEEQEAFITSWNRKRKKADIEEILHEIVDVFGQFPDTLSIQHLLAINY